eukprot:GILJ01011973.1.p1 GENE.GILJ01011973.1~~GILJ01011973.1.p1  ORF type:complete len:737 (+),score=163.53 GILJ01011973.1:31-2241(+)
MGDNRLAYLDDARQRIHLGARLIKFNRRGVGDPRYVRYNDSDCTLTWSHTSSTSDKLTGSLSLLNVYAVLCGVPSNMTVKRGVADLCMSIVTAGRTYIFQASTEEERGSWVAALDVYMQEAKGNDQMAKSLERSMAVEEANQELRAELASMSQVKFQLKHELQSVGNILRSFMEKPRPRIASVNESTISGEPPRSNASSIGNGQSLADTLFNYLNREEMYGWSALEELKRAKAEAEEERKSKLELKRKLEQMYLQTKAIQSHTQEQSSKTKIDLESLLDEKDALEFRLKELHDQNAKLHTEKNDLAHSLEAERHAFAGKLVAAHANLSLNENEKEFLNRRVTALEELAKKLREEKDRFESDRSAMQRQVQSLGEIKSQVLKERNVLREELALSEEGRLFAVREAEKLTRLLQENRQRVELVDNLKQGFDIWKVEQGALRRVHVSISDDCSMMSWKTSDKGFFSKERELGSVSIRDITDVAEGTQSVGFFKVNVPADKSRWCWSLITPDLTLDLVADSEEEFQRLSKGCHALFEDYGSSPSLAGQYSDSWNSLPAVSADFSEDKKLIRGPSHATKKREVDLMERLATAAAEKEELNGLVMDLQQAVEDLQHSVTALGVSFEGSCLSHQHTLIRQLSRLIHEQPPIDLPNEFMKYLSEERSALFDSLSDVSAVCEDLRRMNEVGMQELQIIKSQFEELVNFKLKFAQSEFEVERLKAELVRATKQVKPSPSTWFWQAD